ncbi:ribosome biogenesis GTP-binding protein YihA/YsxC [Porphyromonas levii]|uniref:Probable GTP-binding protein EngB n=1 Tax=Porphyromonas levii TaxID=28114 RepID=A0A4Y8WQF0_9PORP|nr:ribosome biogenesis GTP-binding protein YihA/YsxC [Porphyromonas levii]MBR8702437.1 putative GTP-binding protein EngB [Porphyromonas levii]MBR8713418.1 putative GTP-binding protein EngB [Porphyromonas levii]MBR8715445.1 putative GTP-binding protein EngB [Porphyromonas levii]MBR8727970.1 putative GTP-binding protein EngB [Porphyromonas levii]MBR8729185.1 putative GTP-binding protein EngB [Porphyromonas levii]
MDITKATFATSSSKTEECPTDGRMELAFIGRSNVGKSSLINMLTNAKGLAKTSSTPGKTQLINHFLVNDSFYIVDLPGYGYAKVPKGMRSSFKSMIYGYILSREQLVNLFILVDVRHDPMKIDIDFINEMGEAGVPFSIVFTKADKLSKSALKLHVEAYQNVLRESWEELPPIFVTSSEKGTGREELVAYIEQILK